MYYFQLIIGIFNAFQQKAPIASQNSACVLIQCAAGIPAAFPAPPPAEDSAKQQTIYAVLSFSACTAAFFFGSLNTFAQARLFFGKIQSRQKPFAADTRHPEPVLSAALKCSARIQRLFDSRAWETWS